MTGSPALVQPPCGVGPGPVSLRDARPTDAGRVGAILSAFIDDTAWMPRLHSRAEDLSFAGTMIERGWVRVALCAGRVEGFLARDGSEVHALYVDPAARRRGLGRRLLAEAQAAEARLTLSTFVANRAARAFYAWAGFREVARGDGSGNDEGLPDIHLAWHADRAREGTER